MNILFNKHWLKLKIYLFYIGIFLIKFILLKRDERESRETKDAELKLLTENLHHLISTAHIRGIFNPPPQFLKVILLYH
jgi:hypothetical protein